jgi:hypothetical protein
LEIGKGVDDAVMGEKSHFPASGTTGMNIGKFLPEGSSDLPGPSFAPVPKRLNGEV